MFGKKGYEVNKNEPQRSQRKSKDSEIILPEVSFY